MSNAHSSPAPVAMPSQAPQQQQHTACSLLACVRDSVVDGGREVVKMARAQNDFYMYLSLATVGLRFLSWAKAKWIPSNTVIELDLNDLELKHASMTPLAESLGRTTTTSKLVGILQMAAADSSVAAVVIRCGRARMNMSQAYELREAISALNKSGKLTVAYAATFGEAGHAWVPYFLATACTHVFVSPAADLTLIDLVAEQPFVKNMLSKLGFTASLFARKEYKNMRNFFAEEKFTDAHREATMSLLDGVREQLFADIAANRGIEAKEFESLVQAGPYRAKQALAAKLVDGLKYRDEVYEFIGEEINKGLAGFQRAKHWVSGLVTRAKPHSIRSLLDYTAYARRKARGPFSTKPFGQGKKVAYINLNGNIHSGRSEADWLGTQESIGSDTACEALRAAIKDTNVEVIIMHVSSRGGSYHASDQIAHYVLVAKARGKKVIAVMSDVAASGGYFISHFADKIVSTPYTITGSIGVVYGKFLTTEFWNNIGISWDHCGHGDNGRLFSGLKKYSDEEAKKINEVIDEYYLDFTSQVARGRGMSLEEVEEVAKGRVWVGNQAKAKGLVDELGGLSKAVEIAKEFMGLKPTDSINLVPYPRRKGLLARILGSPRKNSEDLSTPATSPPLLSVLAHVLLARGGSASLSPAAAIAQVVGGVHGWLGARAGVDALTAPALRGFLASNVFGSTAIPLDACARGGGSGGMCSGVLAVA